MSLQTAVYERLPDCLKPVAVSMYTRFTSVATSQYRSISPYRQTDQQLHAAFVDDIFESRAEYEGYVDEFERGSAVTLRDKALEQYRRLTGKENMGAIDLDTARDYYAVTRTLRPSTVVETGVCNGVSTLAVLLALAENDHGTLHSIDYPFRADEPLEEFRQSTFKEYGGAAIPGDKDPGWIVPDQLRDRWELRLGKSQRELPGLVGELEEFDLFIHDSEHSHPCMMFEYELAYEWLAGDGIILSDDINWNEAFSIFVDVRETVDGKLSNSVGYIHK